GLVDGVAFGAHRNLDAGNAATVTEDQRDVLRALIGVVHEPGDRSAHPLHQTGLCRPSAQQSTIAGAFQPKNGARAVSSARAQGCGGPSSWSARRAAAESLVLRHLIAGDVVL